MLLLYCTLLIFIFTYLFINIVKIVILATKNQGLDALVSWFIGSFFQLHSQKTQTADQWSRINILNIF